MNKKITAALSLLLTGVVGVSALGIARAVSAADEPKVYEVTLADFETRADLMSVSDFYSEIEPIGFWTLTENGDENAIEGKSRLLSGCNSCGCGV